MTITDNLIISDIGSFIGLASILALGIFFISTLVLVVYIYSSLVWFTIAKELKYKRAWLAWIPILNIAMFLEMGGFHFAWIFLIFIPVLGWIPLFILVIIATWKIFERRNYPGWFSLSMIFPKIGGILYLIAIGFVAWGKPTNNAYKTRKKINNKKKK